MSSIGRETERNARSLRTWKPTERPDLQETIRKRSFPTQQDRRIGRVTLQAVHAPVAPPAYTLKRTKLKPV